MSRQPHPILVVDDEPDIRDLMVSVLESEGYAANFAAHGAEALEQLRQGRRPCIILLDLMMPVMDGWTFCREKAKDPALAAIPVVVLSAVSPKDPRNANMSVVDYLQKPLDLPKLLAAVQRHC